MAQFSKFNNRGGKRSRSGNNHCPGIRMKSFEYFIPEMVYAAITTLKTIPFNVNIFRITFAFGRKYDYLCISKGSAMAFPFF